MTPAEITEWRHKLGLPANGAAEALGCSRSALRRWERGDTTIPRYIGLACEALNQHHDSEDSQGRHAAQQANPHKDL